MGWWDDFWDSVGDFFEDVGDFFEDAYESLIGYEEEQERRDYSDRARGVLINRTGTAEHLDVIYGTRKVGGIKLGRYTAGSSNEKFYIAFLVCLGEIDSFPNIWFDDVLSTDAKFSGKFTATEYYGTAAQAADPTFMAAGIGWQSTDTFSGIAYLACEFTYDQDVWRREPKITVEVKGKKVLDTRTSTTAWSDNPALCLYDYMTDSRYGKGLTTSELNTASFDAAADAADALVTPYTGAADQKKFTCNMVVSTGETVMNNVRDFLPGMLGLLPRYDEQYFLIIETTGTSDFTLDEDNILGGISIQGPNKSNRYNRVVATFVNPDKEWQSDEIEFPATGSADYTTYLTEDNSFARTREIDLPSVTDIYRARHIAEVKLLRSRYGIRAGFKAAPAAAELAIGDIVDITHSTPGWSAKLFRVIGIIHNPDFTVSLSVIEHQDAIYPFSEGSLEPASPGTLLPDPLTVGVPGAPTIVETLYETTGSSALKTKATATWAASADGFIDFYQLEYKLTADSTWTIHPPTEGLTVDIFDMVPGSYDFRVKAVNQIGAASDYATNPTQEIRGLSDPPATPSGLTISSVGGLAVLRWTQATEPDVKKGGSVRFRHSKEQTGATWQTSVSIGEALPGVATECVLPLKIGTYLMKFVDASGIASTTAASVSTKGANVIAFTDLTSLQEDAVFTGTHTDTIFDAVDSTLKLAGQGLFDDVTDVDSLADWDFGEGVATSGTYDFAAGFDLGSVKTVKLETTVAVTVTAALDNIDQRTENIDDWEDFDGNAAGVGDLVVWVRETDDDPDAAPTWSSWQRLDAAEYTARGFDFQARLSTEDPAFNIHVSQLRVAATEVV